MDERIIANFTNEANELVKLFQVIFVFKFTLCLSKVYLPIFSSPTNKCFIYLGKRKTENFDFFKIL